jgi:hypothetical protein
MLFVVDKSYSAALFAVINQMFDLLSENGIALYLFFSYI